MSDRPVLLDYVASPGHKVFDGPHLYDMNVIGIRTAPVDGAYPVTDRFDDRLALVYRDENGWVCRTWKVTTDPGRWWMQHGRTDGTAVLAFGQYRSSHRIGMHRGSYEALCQTGGGKVRVHRDADKDEEFDLDPDSVDEGRFGINIHRASAHRETETVGRYSAGCTVFADPDDFAAFLSICKKQVEVNGWETFTYTLVAEPMM